MKRIISLFLLTLIIMVSAPYETSAQVKINSNRYGLKVTVKKVVAISKDVVVEGLLTNNDNSDMKIYFIPSQSVAFDDEGNRYDRNISVFLGNTQLYNYTDVIIPAGTNLKYKFIIEDVDPAANILTYLKIDGNHGGIVFRNLTINREDY